MPVAAASTTWTQTTQADFNAGTLVQLDAATSPGDVMLAQTAGGFVYALKGNNTKTFWRYNIATNSWASLADAPWYVNAGGALAYDGNNYIYGVCGGGLNYFWRYDITANTSSLITPVSSVNPTINTGGALVYINNSVYAFSGGNTKTFSRYDIAGNRWYSMKNTPGFVNGGGALTYGGGDFIFAFQGQTTAFWKYSISSNNWSTLTSTLSAVGDGGALASDGGNYIYATKGNDTVNFWRYDITVNTWASMADTPATPCIYGGGALVYDYDGHVYALRGNGYSDFWRYDVLPNTWNDTLHDTPSGVAYGGALAFRPTSAYYSSGTLTSSTYDAGSVVDFGTISWTAVTPASTAIKFQIATNNDSANWYFIGPDGTSSTYYTLSGTTIWSGSNVAHYIRYKAFFSTTNTAITPVLNDVSITCNPHINLPVASTANATLVEETTATLNGKVVSDGGETCQYRFAYGTSPGVYTFTTTWTGSVTTGQNFSADVTDLSQGTMYYFIAQVKNSAGTGAGAELYFLTKPEAPTNFTATVDSSTQISLNWTKGLGAINTLVLRKTDGYPTDRNDGMLVYFGIGTSIVDNGLEPETTYYYRAWSEVTVSPLQQWSDDYAETSAKTSTPPTTPPTTTPPTTTPPTTTPPTTTPPTTTPPTTTPPTTTPPTTTTPVSVGGIVYPIDKMQVMLPWLAILGFILLVGGALVCKLIMVKMERR